MPTTTVNTFGPRAALERVRPDEAVLVPVTVKSGFVVKQGDVIGKISASSLYRRRTHALATGSGFATNSAVGHVDDASVFADGDALTKLDGTAIGTIAANGVDKVNNTVTLTGNAAVAVAAGAAVLGSDGSQVSQGISDNETDGTGDTPISAFIAGFLDESKLRGLDATAKTELGGASVAGGIFKF
jgi:hypothetical protein